MMENETGSRPLTNEERSTVEANMGLVGKLVRQRYHNDSRQDDLVSAGYLGLIHAVKKYDASHGIFSSYAVRWILSYVQTEKRRLMFFRVASGHYTEKKSQLLSDEVREAGQWAIKARKVSWEDADAAAVLAVESGQVVTDYEALYEQVDALLPNHQAVILSCVQGQYSDADVARKLGVSKTRVRQIREASLATLRRRLLKLERLGAL